MGKHRGSSRKSTPSKSEVPASLADLVSADVPRDETGEATEPTNPDLWGDDPFYDRNERPRFAAWALALVLIIVLLVVGGISWMFGRGAVDGMPVSSSKTIVTVTKGAAPALVPAPKTVIVTRKSQITVAAAPEPPKTVIFTKTIAPQSTLTAHQKVPDIRVTVRTTITRTATSAPRTVTLCFGVWRNGAQDPIDCP